MRVQKPTGEQIVNGCLLLTSVFYLVYTATHYKLGTVKMPKEGFMPLILGVGMVGLSGFLTAQALLGKGDAKNVRFDIQWWRFLAIVAVSALYALLLVPVGYLPGTFVYLLVIFKLSRLKGLKLPLIVSFAATAGFYVLFKVALGVALPAGFIGI